MSVKIALPSEQIEAIGALTLAFSTDPMARWSLPNPQTYLSIFPSLAEAFGSKSFEKKAAYVSEGFSGAALWLPPGNDPDGEKLLALLIGNAPRQLEADMKSIFEQMEKFRPKTPHWYLPLIGVDPAHQGSGVGSSLLNEGLRAIDLDHQVAYLESSNPKNISLYERHGFEVIGEIRSGNSPTVRPMIRHAR